MTRKVGGARAPAATTLAASLHPALLRLSRRMRAQQVDTSMTLAQMSTMQTLIVHGALTPGALARYEHIQPPSMTMLLASLEERQLVKRVAHPVDRRKSIIEITEAGEALVDRERRSRDRWFATVLSRLTIQEHELLWSALPVLERLGREADVGPR